MQKVPFPSRAENRAKNIRVCLKQAVVCGCLIPSVLCSTSLSIDPALGDFRDCLWMWLCGRGCDGTIDSPSMPEQRLPWYRYGKMPHSSPESTGTVLYMGG